MKYIKVGRIKKFAFSILFLALLLSFSIFFLAPARGAMLENSGSVYIVEGGNAETLVEIDEEADRALEGIYVTEGSPFCS